MPAYTPPANDAVDFALQAYTEPANDAVDFDLSESGTTLPVLDQGMLVGGFMAMSGGLA